MNDLAQINVVLVAKIKCIPVKKPVEESHCTFLCES